MYASRQVYCVFVIQILSMQFLLAGVGDSQERLTLRLENVTLVDIFDQIEEQTDFVFSYNKDVLNDQKRYSFHFNNEDLKMVLGKISKQTMFNFHLEDHNIYVIKRKTQDPVMIIEDGIEIKISGIVMDELGEPLVGATVRIKDTNLGTVTDMNGNFQLAAPAGNNVLIFSYIGFVTKEIPIGNKTKFEVMLQPNTEALGEVLVVGYGFQKKVDLTGSVASVLGSEINKRPITQASQALQGLAPGVFVNTNSGEPGNDQADIAIRGIGTLGNSSPLVLVDGIEASINSVNPQNIESINVLKDAASASIYGTRGANGVILITTKQGKFNQPTEITYDGYFGISNPTVIPDLLWDNETYLELYREAATNAGLSVNYTDADIARYAGLPSTNWMEVVVKGNAPITNHNLTFQGGSDKMNYFYSSGYLFQQGYLVDQTEYNRFSNRLNLNTNLTDHLTFSAKISYFKEYGTLESKYNTRKGRGSNSIDGKGGSVWSGGFVNHPIAPVYDALGRYGSIEEDLGIERNRPNPVAVADKEVPELDSDDLLGKLSLIYEPINNLKFTGNIGINYKNEVITTIKKEYVTYDPVTLEAWTNDNGTLNEGNLAYLDLNKTFNITTWLQADYSLAIEDNQFDFLIGYNNENQNSETQRILESEFATSDVINIGQGEQVETSEEILKSKLASVFGRVSYNFDQKYFLEANFRADGSSRFGSNNRWATFPAFSAGWIITNESFWTTSRIISFLKVRGSWGIIGNQSTNRYPFVSQISLTSSHNGEPGAALTQLGNPDLRWEETQTTNIGLELGFFGDHFSVESDYFFKSTSDILTDLDNPLTAGISSTTTVNAASMENKGVEILATYRNDFGDFHFEISGNVTYVENKVVAVNPDLSDEEDRIIVSSQSSNNVYIIRGKPMNVIYGHKQNGIFQESDFNEDGTLIDGIPDHSYIGTPIPGGFRYTDQNGDGVINEDDQVIIGDRQPKWLYGSNLSLAYKGFEVSAMIQGIGKADAWISRSWGPFPFAGLRQFWVENRWTPENPSNENPGLWVDRSGYNGESIQKGGKVLDYWVADRAYLRLKNIRIAYTLPVKTHKTSLFKSIQLYVSGQNLWTKTDLMDIDPERYSMETQADNSLPQSKIILIGIHATL